MLQVTPTLSLKKVPGYGSTHNWEVVAKTEGGGTTPGVLHLSQSGKVKMGWAHPTISTAEQIQDIAITMLLLQNNWDDPMAEVPSSNVEDSK